MNDNPDPRKTPGRIIKAARDVQKISLNDAAAKLLLSKQIVADIEEDDYSKISAQVYAEGYLKKYAQLLQIPVDELLTSFRDLNIYSTGDEPRLELEDQDKSGLNIAVLFKDQRVRLISLGFVLLLLAVFGFKWFNNKDADVVSIPSALSNLTEDEKEFVDEEEGVPVVTVNVSDDIVEFGVEDND